jgi:hypothetical protein
MLSNRARARVLLGAVAIGLGGVGVASCGSSESKHVMPPSDEAGAAGETGGGAGGSSSSAAGGPVVGRNEAGQSNGGSPPTVEDDGGFGGTIPIGSFGGAPTEAEAAGAGGEVAATCAPVQSRITIAFAEADPEHITSLQWKDSADATTPNVIGEGGPLHCTDVQEFFGQSYGAPEGTLPLPVVGGNLATLTRCGTDVTLTSAAQDCTQVAQQPVTTQYHFYGGTQASEMRVTRTIGFDASTPVYAGTVGLRPYVPRVALSGLNTVIYPNQANSAVTTTPSTNCGGDCFTATGATWNGTWFADIDPTTGLALIVLRDPSMTSPVNLTINYDSYSNANLASFVLLQPADGWKAPVTEVEYLCFADLTSWPQTARDAAQLPAGCGP